VAHTLTSLVRPLFDRVQACLRKLRSKCQTTLHTYGIIVDLHINIYIYIYIYIYMHAVVFKNNKTVENFGASPIFC
jgi:hypothetical protein